MPTRTLEAVAFWLAVVAATLMLVGFAGKLAYTGQYDLKPLSMGLLMVLLAVGTWTRRRAAVHPTA